MDLSINFKNKKKNQNFDSNQYSKNDYIFFEFLEICKILKKLKTQAQT